MVAALQYGAIGLGAIVLAYTAALLRMELGRDVPRPEGRTLILMFMAFSLACFAMAAFLELRKQTGDDVSAKQMSEIKQIAAALDASLDGKAVITLRESVSQGQMDNIKRFEEKLCREIADLKAKTHMDGAANCLQTLQMPTH